MKTKLAQYVREPALIFRAWLNQTVDARWNNSPFGDRPHASREDYLAWFEQTRALTFPKIDDIEAQLGYAICPEWLDRLALHTQIVKKNSNLAYPHGRLLYALLRKMLADCGLGFVTILETGTARGFSALCMAKALADAHIDGRIVTVDVLPHLKRQIWNCIDDHDGPKSRAEILEPWSELLDRILFIQGDTLSTLPRLGLDRIHFAFLDAQHIESSVLQEFQLISERQKPGDIVVFDDVTEDVFPGVVQALKHIEQRGDYEVEYLSVSDQRAYAWARRSHMRADRIRHHYRASCSEKP